MSKVDWSLAPEGYPLWLDDLNKCVGGDMSGWHRDDGDRYTDEQGLHWLKKDSEDYTVYHRPTPQPKPWSGPQDGLPPVGTECEYRIEPSNQWHEGEIRYYMRSSLFEAPRPIVWNDHLGFDQIASEKWHFRAISTPEQLAAEQRETAIREIMDAAGIDCRVTAARLVDAGFKREVV